MRASSSWIAGALALASLRVVTGEPPPAPPVAPAPPPTPVPEPKPELPEVRYLGPEEVRARLERIAARPAWGRRTARLERYATTVSGRGIWVLRVGPEDAPQVLVHGGLGARDAAGTAAALDFAERVLPDPAGTGARARPATPPDESVGYLIIPAPHPDALANFVEGKGWPHGGPDVDRDLDGRLGEDGPDDLDGDGEILMMRRKRPEGTFVIDDAPAKDGKVFGDPRLMRDAGLDARRAVSYERPVPEGRDDDGDGDVNEDAPGTDLTRNMMGVWEEMGPWPGDGPFPGSAPATQGLMELSFDTPNLVAWYGFSSEGPRLERASERGKDADADDGLYGALAGKWQELAGGVQLRKASERPGAGDDPGSDLDWAARHLGVVALRVPVWRIAKEASVGRDRADPDELDWLVWNDRVLGGKGFVPWHEVKHPQWGSVEVGGWKRYTRHEPPADLLPAAVRAVSAVPLTHGLLGFVPRLEVRAETEAVPAGLVRIKARVVNLGAGPTETRRAELAQRAMGVHLRFVPAAGIEVVSGPRSSSLGTLGAGGFSGPVEWMVKAGAAGTLGTLEARHRVAGTVKAEVKQP